MIEASVGQLSPFSRLLHRVSRAVRSIGISCTLVARRPDLKIMNVRQRAYHKRLGWDGVNIRIVQAGQARGLTIPMGIECGAPLC